jgi:hypothetical protein
MYGDDKANEGGEPCPPPAPDMPRRFRLHNYQKVGLPLLVLVPVLAMGGLFGESTDTTDLVTQTLLVEIDYPTRLRYRTSGEMVIRVTNRSTEALDSLIVTIDPAYLSGFSDVNFIPDVDRAFAWDLLGLAPGEERRIVIEYSARDYWNRKGRVSVSGVDIDSATLPVTTFVFP